MMTKRNRNITNIFIKLQLGECVDWSVILRIKIVGNLNMTYINVNSSKNLQINKKMSMDSERMNSACKHDGGRIRIFQIL
jgi:hypothetical protein